MAPEQGSGQQRPFYRNKKFQNIGLWVLIGIFYLVLAVFFTWPLASNLSSSIIGQSDFTDGPFFLWNLWWVKEAIFSLKNPFFTDFVYFPAHVNLTMHTLTLTSGLLSLPIQEWLGLVKSLNMILFFSMVATGLGMVALMKYLTGNRFIGMVSGVVFGFSPYLFSHLQAGHFNLTMLWLIPLTVLFFYKILREKKIYNPIVFAILVALQSYLDLQVAVFNIFILVILLVGYGVLEAKNTFSRHTLLRLVLALALYLGLFALPYYLLIKGFWSGSMASEIYNNGDLKIIFGLNPLSPYFANENLKLTLRLIGSYRENVISLGFAAMALSILAFIAVKRNLKEKIIYLIMAIAGVVLAMGPYIQFDQKVIYGFHLPFFYLAKLPFFDAGIVPTRFIVIAYFAIAVLAGLTFFDLWVFTKRKKLLWLGVILMVLATALVSFEYYCGQMKTDSLSVSPIFEEIKNMPGDFTVLPAISTARDGYYQTVHQKKVVSGYLGRRVHDYYEAQYANEPGLRRLASDRLDPMQEDDLNRDKVIAALLKYKVKYVYIDKTNHKTDVVEHFRNYIGSTIELHAYREDKGVLVFEVN